MDKLNYTKLNQLLPKSSESPRMVDIVDVDVKRLRDDHSEIQLGQEAAFVATFAIRVTQEGVRILQDLLKWDQGGTAKEAPETLAADKVVADKVVAKKRAAKGEAAEPVAAELVTAEKDAWRHLASEDKLLVVGAAAEVRSDTVPIDEDSITAWIDDHYKFTFLLNGKANKGAFHDIGRVRLSKTDAPGPSKDLALPWVTKLNVGDIDEDYIDVDVRIEEKPHDTEQSPKAEEIPDILPTSNPINCAINLEVVGNASQLKKLINQPLHVVGQNGDQISLKITIMEPRAARSEQGA